MKNILENLEIKLLQTKRENAEKLDKIETEFKKKFSDFLDVAFKNDNLGLSRFISVYFQLKKLDNPEKNDLDILKNAIYTGVEKLPSNIKQKEKLVEKLNNFLSNNNTDIFLKHSDIHKNHNYIILQDLQKHGILDKKDLLSTVLKYKETNSFLESLKNLSDYKKEIIKSHYYELNNYTTSKRQEHFEHDFKNEIIDSKLLKIYPKILKFVGRYYIRLKLKNKYETKKQKLRRLYKIAFLKFYRLKYSGIDIDKILEQIDTLSNFDDFINLIIKYFEILKQNTSLQQDYIVSEEVDEIDNLVIQAEENKEKILFSEKNTIKVNEIFEEIDKKFTKDELELLLSNDVDLVGNEFKKREIQNIDMNGVYANSINIVKEDKNDDEDENLEELDVEEYYEELKEKYQEIEEKKRKIFLKGKFEDLDNINEELLNLEKKLEKLGKIIGYVPEKY